MNATNTTNFAATIGLDWADQRHDLWIRPAAQGKAEHLRLDHKPQTLHEWVAKLRERFDNQPVAVAVETSRGPVLSALMAYDFIVLFPVNPKSLKDYRAAFCVSGAKDDRTDSMLLEELVRLHRDKLNALEPDTELTRKLAGLVENRRHLVAPFKQITSLKLSFWTDRWHHPSNKKCRYLSSDRANRSKMKPQKKSAKKVKIKDLPAGKKEKAVKGGYDSAGTHKDTLNIGQPNVA